MTAALWLLVFRLVRRARPGLGQRQACFAALAATLLFAVHPLRVEVVAWVSCQGYLPCALLAILAVLFYERAADGPQRLTLAGLPRRWAFSSVPCFVTRRVWACP